MDRAAESLADLTLVEFTERLASAEPVPGGGSASAVAGSFAGSLLAMVARLSLDRPKYESFRATNERAAVAGDWARTRLLALADDDARAYAAFSAARKLPRATQAEQDEREAATRVAARAAAEVPLEVVRECATLLDEIAAAVGRSNLNAASDLEVAGRLTSAAARGAAANVMINLPMVGDESYSGATTATLYGLLDQLDRMVANITQVVGSGALREPESE